jgi:predicted helicase
LPRIPIAAEFWRFAEFGAALMKLHLEYEKQKEYPLGRRETGKLNWRVEKMALSKDKSKLRYNEFLHPTDEDLSVGTPVSDVERDSGGGV